MPEPVCTVTTGRFTSKDLVVQFLPCGTSQVHIQQLRFHADVTGGTFKLRVNGEETAAITYSDTIATLLSNINTALDNLVGLAAGEIVATGTLGTNVTLTSNVSKWYTLEISLDSLTGNSTSDPNVTTDVTQQGSMLYTLTSQVSQFSYEETVETVDVTGVSEWEATELPVKSSMTFDMSVYEANETWKHAVFAGQSGKMYVYPKGKVAGREYFAFQALFDTVSVDFPDHEVVEASMSGVRQGAMIVPFHSYYAG